LAKVKLIQRARPGRWKQKEEAADPFELSSYFSPELSISAAVSLSLHHQ